MSMSIIIIIGGMLAAFVFPDSKIIAVVALLLIGSVAFFGQSNEQTSGSYTISSCKKECKTGYDAAVRKVENAGLSTSGMRSTLIACNTECEKNPNF